MNYRIEKNAEKTAYMQLYELLKADIISGVYRYGSKLPSKRTLADETHLSVMPVMHAYNLLCEEGYIEPRERSGYFVIYRENDFHTFSPAAGRELSHVPASGSIFSHATASDGRPALSPAGETGPSHPQAEDGRAGGPRNEFPYSVLAKTMRRVLSEYADQLLVKSPNCGCTKFRRAIASYLARSIGIFADPAQVIVGSGSEYLYSLIAQLLGGHRSFALEDPSYEKIRSVYEANGISCDMLKLGRDGIRSDELRRTRAAVLHITPFSNFPSGVTASASKKQEYIRWARTRGGFIIEDNYASELTLSKKNEDTVFSLAGQESVLYLNTFSQTIAPSIRVGYMVLPESLLETFDQKLGFYSCTVPTFEQYVLTELLETGEFERHINRVRREKRRERQTARRTAAPGQITYFS